MAGSVPITQNRKRANTVRPQITFDKKDFNHLHNELGEVGAEKVDTHEEEKSKVQAWKGKIDDLETRVAEQFEDDQGKAATSIPMVKAPIKPTQREWDQHQLTHIPFAPWCPFCLAARNIRRNHPKQGRPGRIVPDIEIGEGRTKVSLDYMYLHDRVG